MEHREVAGRSTGVDCSCGWHGWSHAQFDAHRDVVAPEHFPPAWYTWKAPPPRPQRPVLADELRRLASRLDGPEYLARERLAEIAGSLRTVAVILDGESDGG